MSFSTRRGRPRGAARTETDRGTPELRAKRRGGATAEAIDLCLDRGVITPDQHWCGLHFRWLYTLRFGVPDAKTAHALYHREESPRQCGDDWTGEREQDYAMAVAVLRESGALHQVMRLCVYNEKPSFLRLPLAARTARWKILLRSGERDIAALQSGLTGLVRLWVKRPASSPPA